MEHARSDNDGQRLLYTGRLDRASGEIRESPRVPESCQRRRQRSRTDFGSEKRARQRKRAPGVAHLVARCALRGPQELGRGTVREQIEREQMEAGDGGMLHGADTRPEVRESTPARRVERSGVVLANDVARPGATTAEIRSSNRRSTSVISRTYPAWKETRPDDFWIRGDKGIDAYADVWLNDGGEIEITRHDPGDSIEGTFSFPTVQADSDEDEDLSGHFQVHNCEDLE